MATGLIEQLVDCSGGTEISEESGVERKLDALHRALRQHPAHRTVVFCNKIETCRKVHSFPEGHHTYICHIQMN